MSQRDAEGAADRAASHAAQQVAGLVQGAYEQARNYRSPGLQLPILAADPSADSPTTLWALSDGRVRARIGGVVIQIPVETAGSPVSATPMPADPMPQRYQKDYAATWGVSYCPIHGAETGTILGYGVEPSHGNRRVMLGFPSTIAADLAGAVIRRVWVRFLNRDAVSDPVRISLGIHASASAPVTFAGTRRNVWTDQWPASGYGEAWHQATDYLGRAFRDGLATGLTIDQPDGLAFAGHINWATARLRISYTR